MPCGGITVTSNIFKNNFGCPIYGGGVVVLRCDEMNLITPELRLDQPPVYTMSATFQNEI